MYRQQVMHPICIGRCIARYDSSTGNTVEETSQLKAIQGQCRTGTVQGTECLFLELVQGCQQRSRCPSTAIVAVLACLVTIPHKIPINISEQRTCWSSGYNVLDDDYYDEGQDSFRDGNETNESTGVRTAVLFFHYGRHETVNNSSPIPNVSFYLTPNAPF
jgi:hypothetical protein